MKNHIISWALVLLFGGLMSFTAFAQEPSIVEMNREAGELVVQSARKYHNWSSVDSVWEPLTLAVITDVHGDETRLERYFEFCNAYSRYIDGRLHLGDIVASAYVDDFSFVSSDPDAAQLMGTIGNHDTMGEPFSHEHWLDHAGKDAFQRYFAPFEGGWLSQVSLPADAAAEGKCYYYRDYPDNRIRLIVLDSMSYSEKQLKWFTEVLDSAVSAGLSVVCCQHLPVGAVEAVSSFNSLDYPSFSGNYSDSPELYLDAVDVFIDKGGEFITWMSGDSHFDFTGTLKNYPRQFSITFENGGRNSYWNDSDRAVGMKSQDSFNIVTFDTYSKLVKVVRVGNTFDRFLRSKKYFTYDYVHRVLVANE